MPRSTTSDLDHVRVEIPVLEQHHAEEHNELRLYYQPQVDIASGRVIGAEALLRWEHPKHGLLMPSQFLALSEESELVVSLGEWVLYTACAQAAAAMRQRTSRSRWSATRSAASDSASATPRCS